MRSIDELRPLKAQELLQIWQTCRQRWEDPLERTVLCNAMVLARCCLFQGEAVYHGEMEALEDLTGPEMEQLLRRISQGGGKIAGAANQEFDMERFERLSGR